MFVSRRITKELDTGCWKQEGITLILDTCAHRVSNSTKIYSSTCVHALTSLFLSLSSLCDSPSLFRELSPPTLRDKLSLSLSPLSSVRDQREDGHRDRTAPDQRLRPPARPPRFASAGLEKAQSTPTCAPRTSPPCIFAIASAASLLVPYSMKQ